MPELRPRKPGTDANGNTLGKVVGEQPSSGQAAATASPPVDDKNILQEGKEVTRNAIDQWVESTGYNQGAMVAGAIATAVAEVFLPESWWELIPVGKVAKIARKGAEAFGIVKKGEHAVEAAADIKRGDSAAKDAADAKKAKGGRDSKVKRRNTNNKEKSTCGEWLAKQDMLDAGYDEVMAVQNKSGQGIDLIGRNSQKRHVAVWEVKTTDTPKAGDFSPEQARLGGEGFTKDRLRRARRGMGNYGKLPEVMKNARRALSWIERAPKVIYEKREIFVDDLKKGCMKHPGRPSRPGPWNAKPKQPIPLGHE